MEDRVVQLLAEQADGHLRPPGGVREFDETVLPPVDGIPLPEVEEALLDAPGDAAEERRKGDVPDDGLEDDRVSRRELVTLMAMIAP